MDIPERLKQSEAQLQKVTNAANALECLGQPKGDLSVITIRLSERIKVYKEILGDKAEIQSDFPESLHKVRESYRVQHTPPLPEKKESNQRKK